MKYRQNLKSKIKATHTHTDFLSFSLPLKEDFTPVGHYKAISLSVTRGHKGMLCQHIL